MTLEKAKLLCRDGSDYDIDFMFNPTEVSFEGDVESSDNPGSRSSESGKPKVSFSNIKAYRITINNILFDTYETNEDVVKKHIFKFKKAVRFVSGKERPPLFAFYWGNAYLDYCFIEKLSYKLTLFLSDGTPVRAVIDSLTLKETDGPANEQASAPAPQPSLADTMQSRRQVNPLLQSMSFW